MESSSTDQHPQTVDDDISWEEFVYWAEFCGWTVLALAPVLRWVNGPSVSKDQYVVRITLVVIGGVVACSIRLTNMVKRKRH